MFAKKVLSMLLAVIMVVTGYTAMMPTNGSACPCPACRAARALAQTRAPFDPTWSAHPEPEEEEP